MAATASPFSTECGTLSRLFVKYQFAVGHASLLDMHNALFHWRDTPEWNALNKQGVVR
jgi:hypothetical protein